MRDPHAVLGVPSGATNAEIKQAYRRLARATHPDRNPGDPRAAERFKEVAAAYGILTDPRLRAAHERRARQVARGDLPEDFLDDVVTAVDRAQTWIEVAVLPEVVRRWRGRGAEMAARFVGDLTAYAPPRVFDAPSWLARRRAARIARDVHVGIEGWPGSDVSSLTKHGREFELLVNPDALWRAGIRTPVDLDAVVMRLLLARYAQVVAVGRLVVEASFDDAAGRDRALRLARAADDDALRRQLVGWALWLALLLFLAAMLYSGYVSRFEPGVAGR